MINNYDVFLSFKKHDDQGKTTRDSTLAHEIYEYLSSRGLKVFFGDISLVKLGVSDYREAIDNALDASSVLVAIGASSAHLKSRWVQYEWRGFHNDILSGRKPEGRVFAYLEGVDIQSLPRALSGIQIFTHGPDSLEQLYNFIANALRVGTRKASEPVGGPSFNQGGNQNTDEPRRSEPKRFKRLWFIMPVIAASVYFAVFIINSILKPKAASPEHSSGLPTIATPHAGEVVHTPTSRGFIVIDKPGNGDPVPLLCTVEATVSKKVAGVWVIVNPGDTGQYWVQPEMKKSGDRQWSSEVSIGRPGDIDKGKTYRIMVVGSPKIALKEGDVLYSWPEAFYRSEVMEVIRR